MANPNQQNTQTSATTGKTSSEASSQGKQGQAGESASQGKEGQSKRQAQKATSLARAESRAPMMGLGAFSASPFSLIRRMMEDMERLFENFGGVPGFPTIGQELMKLSQISSPPVSPAPERDTAKREERAAGPRRDPAPGGERLTVSIEEKPTERRPETDQVSAGQVTRRGTWWPNAERSRREPGL